jgi:hypothetical protein
MQAGAGRINEKCRKMQEKGRKETGKRQEGGK